MAGTPYFSLRITKSTDLKWVISVSKKVSKSAVVRNTIKRRIKAILRESYSGIEPATYLLVAKPGSKELKGQVLKAELATLFKKS
jgi:ribonuclease P protein component